MATTVLEADGGGDLTPWWTTGRQTLTGLLAQMEDALDALVGFDLSLTDGEELGEGLVASQRLRAKFAAVEAKLVGTFDAAGAFRRDGSRSTATWLAGRSNTPRAQVQQVVRRARRLRAMPATAAAAEQGQLAPERVDVLARQAGSPRRPVAEAFVHDEGALVEAAATKSFDEFRRDVNYWRDRVDPDDAERQAQKLHDARRVHLSQSFEGQWFLDGLIDPVAGAELAEALRRVDDDLHRADRRAAEAVHGEGCPEDLLARTPAQRRADALVELARLAMAAPADARKPAPLISILVGYETFRGPIVELFNGTKLTPGQVAMRITDADIERVVFDPPGRDISDLGRRSRFFNAAQRRVVEVRDRTCRVHDCDEPAERCDMDHFPHRWADGGGTNIGNGRPACELHNRIHDDRAGPDPPGSGTGCPPTDTEPGADDDHRGHHSDNC